MSEQMIRTKWKSTSINLRVVTKLSLHELYCLRYINVIWKVLRFKLRFFSEAWGWSYRIDHQHVETALMRFVGKLHYVGFLWVACDSRHNQQRLFSWPHRIYRVISHNTFVFSSGFLSKSSICYNVRCRYHDRVKNDDDLVSVEPRGLVLIEFLLEVWYNLIVSLRRRS